MMMRMILGFDWVVYYDDIMLLNENNDNGNALAIVIARARTIVTARVVLVEEILIIIWQ